MRLFGIDIMAEMIIVELLVKMPVLMIILVIVKMVTMMKVITMEGISCIVMTLQILIHILTITASALIFIIKK